MAGESTVQARLDALNDVVSRLMAAGSESEVCTIAVSAVPAVFDVELGGLWLYDADAAELQLTASTERADAVFDGTVVYRPGNSLSWEAFDSGDVRLLDGEDGAGQRYDADSRVGSELVLPLGEHGVMNVGSTEEGEFGPADVRLARLLATNVEAALTKAEREHALRLKNDRLEEFVGLVSHDIRNPLNVASGSLEVVRDDCDSPHLDGIADGLDRVESLVDDLLTLADQGYVVADRTRLDLASLAERAWSHVHAPDATLRTDGTLQVFGDEKRLLQVFENCFRNAVEHGGDDVTVRVGPLETFHTSTRIDAADEPDGFYVEDDGVGISADEGTDVFDTTYSTGGTGLGLAIVQRIVAAHGWKIAAEESVTGGARFVVTGDTRDVAPFESF